MNNSNGRFEIGIIGNAGNKSELLKEILNHQGVIFRDIGKLKNNSTRFPCVIITEDKIKDINKAKKHCINEDNLLIMDRIIPTKLILSAFSGNLDKLYLEKKLMDPLVTKFELKILNRIRRCYFRLELPFIRKWFWPNFFQSCLVMSHDIDDLNISPLDASIFKKPWDFLSYFGTRYIRKIPSNNNLWDIISLEKQKGIHSTYYFLANYGKFQKHLPDVLHRINNEKHEIGLHGSLHTAHNPDLLAKEKKILEDIIKKHISSGRQHGLHFLSPHTWKYYKEIGMTNDSTFSYNDAFGFRSGICSPYHPFDILNNKRMELLEIPLSFMDWTGFYQQLDFEKFQKIIDELENTVEKYNGCLSMNFHNKFLNKSKYPHIMKLFENVLDHVKENNYWIATSKECASWWRLREDTKIDIKEEKDRIQIKTSDLIPIIIEEKDKKRKCIQPTSKTFQIT